MSKQKSRYFDIADDKILWLFQLKLAYKFIALILSSRSVDAV